MPLSKFSEEDFCKWFVDGVSRMCGCHPIEREMSEAFAPVADQVGYDKRISWTDEVVLLLNKLPDQVKEKCHRGLRLALPVLTERIDEFNFPVVVHGLNIMRDLKPIPYHQRHLEAVFALLVERGENKLREESYLGSVVGTVYGCLRDISDRCSEADHPFVLTLAKTHFNAASSQARKSGMQISENKRLRFMQELEDFGVPKAKIALVFGEGQLGNNSPFDPTPS